VPKVGTSPLVVGFASKLAPTGRFFGVEHILIQSKLTLVNGYILKPVTSQFFTVKRVSFEMASYFMANEF
jgi:hypothetical protein